jgi:hypothetical protein
MITYISFIVLTIGSSDVRKVWMVLAQSTARGCVWNYHTCSTCIWSLTVLKFPNTYRIMRVQSGSWENNWWCLLWKYKWLYIWLNFILVKAKRCSCMLSTRSLFKTFYLIIGVLLGRQRWRIADSVAKTNSSYCLCHKVGLTVINYGRSDPSFSLRIWLWLLKIIARVHNVHLILCFSIVDELSRKFPSCLVSSIGLSVFHSITVPFDCSLWRKWGGVRLPWWFSWQ